MDIMTPLSEPVFPLVGIFPGFGISTRRYALQRLISLQVQSYILIALQC